MKFLILLIGMVGMSLGAWNSYQKRNLLIEAALLSEGFSLSQSVKKRVSDYYFLHNLMPHDNAEVELPPANSIFGTSVKRVSVNRSGLVVVDFAEEIGSRSMLFTPNVSPGWGNIEWHCTSDSIDPKILELMKPGCSSVNATKGGQLINAIANGNAAAVETLLGSGVNPDVVVNGNTPLMLAAKLGNLEIAKMLVNGGASVDNNALNSERRTPLMVAINSNRGDVVAYLLAKGASVTRRDYKGMSAQEHATNTDKRLGGERYELMVLARLNPNFAGKPQLYSGKKRTSAQQKKHLDSLYVELSQAADRCNVRRIVSLLSEEGDYKPTELFLGKPISTYVTKPVCSQQLQAYIKTKDVYEIALESRFAAASSACDQRKVEAMKKRNPLLDVMQKTLMYSHFERALFSGCTNTVSYFIRHEKLENKLDDDILIRTVKKAPKKNQIELVGKLIEAGADVNYVDRNGDSPLAVAIAFDQAVVAKYILDAGADVNAPTASQSYPLIEASKKGFNHLAAQLVSKGADINQQDAFGRTALLASVATGNRRMVDTLLRSGANPTIKDNDGISAFMLAESKNHKQIFSQLTSSASADY